MPRYRAGEMVRHWREQAGLTIEELAGTAMEPSTLWRIEEGVTMPTKGNLEYLFQKLNIDPGSHTMIFVDKKLADIQRTMDELERHLKNRNAAAAKRLINKLERNKSFMQNKFNVQSLLAKKATYASISRKET